MNIAVFSSHNGSDLQAIIDWCQNKSDVFVCAVICNNSDAYALERARQQGIKAYHVSQKIILDPDCLDSRILQILSENKTDIIFLAGYLKKLGVTIIKKYHGRIFNIHPALLPQYCGKGMYGIHVHKAVIEAGEPYTGITIHRVDEEYDHGEIIAQTKVKVLEGDTPELLAERVLQREHTFLAEVLSDILSGKIKLSVLDDK